MSNCGNCGKRAVVEHNCTTSTIITTVYRQAYCTRCDARTIPWKVPTEWRGIDEEARNLMYGRGVWKTRTEGA